MATITLKDTTAVAGAFVYLSGTGFKSGETVNLVVKGQVAGHLPCNANGDFAGQMQVPRSLATGATSCAAVGNTSGLTDDNAFTVSS